MKTISEQDQKTKQYLLIADSHLRSGDADAVSDFFSMLDRISFQPGTTGVVFLGDIFELWIAIAGYEEDIHRQFCDWCANETAKRRILFLEGNHEFFISARKNCFTSTSQTGIRAGTVLFTHGDLVNTRDTGYKLLRFAVRNPLTYSLLWLFRKWIGPMAADRVRLSLKDKNMIHKKTLPEGLLELYTDRQCRLLPEPEDARKKQLVVMGHFHSQEVRLYPEKRNLQIVPAWAKSGEIGLLNAEKGKLRIAPWREFFPEQNFFHCKQEHLNQ